MMFRTLVALSALLVSGVAPAMDLMDLYREAKANDARYAGARAQFRATQERVPQTRAGVMTDFNLGRAYKRYEYHGAARFPAFSSGRSHRFGGEPVRPTFRSP